MASSGTPKVLIICGIATLTMLMSMTDTNEPRTTVPAMIHLLAAVVCAAAWCCIDSLAFALKWEKSRWAIKPAALHARG